MTTRFEALAGSPRPPGSAEAMAALDYCAEQLTPLGFTAVKRPFEFSAVSGRYGAPIIGGVALALLGTTCLLGALADSDLLYWAIAGVAIPIAMAVRLQGASVTRRGYLMERGTNLEATRGESPKVWLVAHIDSKSQTVSTAVRTLSVLLVTLGGIAALVAALVQRSMVLPPAIWMLLFGLGGMGGMVLVVCRVGNASDGAADNASGVAAVLEAASLIPRTTPLGVLITDGEEVSLVGARAWVVGRAPAIAINCDTIDDAGLTTVFSYRDAELADAAERAMAVDGPVRRMGPPPAVLTDSVAFREAGWRTVTVSRGDWRTIARIHTPHDSLAAMTGSAIDEVAGGLARLVSELTS